MTILSHVAHFEFQFPLYESSNFVNMNSIKWNHSFQCTLSNVFRFLFFTIYLLPEAINSNETVYWSIRIHNIYCTIA